MHRPSTTDVTFARADTLHPGRTRVVRIAEGFVAVAGIVGTVVDRGLTRITEFQHVELGIVVLSAMLLLSLGLLQRYRWSLARSTFRRNNRAAIVLTFVWPLGIVVLLLLAGPAASAENGSHVGRYAALVAWSELLVVLRGISGILSAVRRAAALSVNPAMILVSSFAVLVLVGTLLLMLPKARAQTDAAEQTGAPVLVALFTATSASCVTGLVVEPTGTYWSVLGQVIILSLFQIGGLGIMTCGAFFAVAAGRYMPIREAATLRDVLESDRLGDVPRLVRSILVFTLTAELVGAGLIWGLFQDLPWGQSLYQSIFHSVSAFCNAGFSLTADSFHGMATRWQVWGAMTALIITGGLGFAVLHNVAIAAGSRLGATFKRQPLFELSRDRVRLTLTTRLVLITTFGLLAGGALTIYLLESVTAPADANPATQACNAWFQSVTFRTAGFSTVDHGDLQPATKLLAVAMMFIGASPGSTGGGVKTVCFALSLLAVASILRGRQRVEVFGRTIPDVLVNRALTIMTLGLAAIMAATMLLVIFENQPDRFLDHLFEATSAFGTVGVSTGITPQLTDPSKLVIVVTMFVGRVGPLTLLVALAGRMRDARYDFPVERVTLG